MIFCICYEKEISCLCVYSAFVLVVKTINMFMVKYSLDGVVAISEIHKHSSECLGEVLVNIKMNYCYCMISTAVCNSICLLKNVTALSLILLHIEEHILNWKSRGILLLTSEEPGWSW